MTTIPSADKDGRNRKPQAVLLRMINGMATLESNLAVSYKPKRITI